MNKLNKNSKLITLKIDKKVETTRTGKCSILGTKIPFPAYVPEIKGSEDWGVFIKNINLFPEKWPVMVQAGYWKKLASSVPLVTLNLDLDTAKAIKEHHFIFYEPPELYSFKIVSLLLKHSFSGNSSTARSFWKHVKEGDYEKALMLLPAFERKFAKAIWPYVLGKLKKETQEQSSTKLSDYRRILESVWLSIDQEYITKLNSLMFETPNLGSTSFIPPMPLLKSTSTAEMISQVLRMNRASGFLVSEKLKELTKDGPSKVSISAPWLHLYLDTSCFEASSEDKGHFGLQGIIQLVESSFNSQVHVGITLTINGIENLKSEQTKKNRLISAIENLDDFAVSHGVPLYLPRSGYYGMELLDYGVEFFGSLLSGGLRYSSGGAFDLQEEYGKTAVYGTGDLNLSDLESYLKNNKELPYLANLPSTIPEEWLLKPVIFRTNFSKPRRIATHTREVREIAESVKKGIPKPAYNYLVRIHEAGGPLYV